MSGPGHTSVSFGSWLAKQIWLLWVNIIPHRSVRSVAGGKNAAGTRGLERVPVGNMAFGRVQNRVLERHVCPPGHEQRPLHSRHSLRSPHGGFLLLECDGVYQHNFISHSNMYAHCHTQMERGLGTVKSHWQSLTTGTSSRGECRDFIWARTTWPICSFEHRVCVIIMIMLWSWQGTFLFLSFSLFHVSLLLSCAHLDFLENAHRTLCLPCAAHIKCHMQSQPGYGCATQWCLWA